VFFYFPLYFIKRSEPFFFPRKKVARTNMVQFQRLTIWVGVLLFFLSFFSCLALLFVRDYTFIQSNSPTQVPTTVTQNAPQPPESLVPTARVVLDQFLPLTAVTSNIQPVIPTPLPSFGYGAVAASADGQSVFSVLPGEHLAFAEFTFDPQTKKYNFLTSAYLGASASTQLKNRIVRARVESTPLAINTDARNIRCPVLSFDDLRLYVAYEDPTVTDAAGNVSFLPFGGFAGKVQVWFNAGGTWIRSDRADLQNPFGAVAADGFGHALRASSSNRGTRCIAVKANFGLFQDEGPTLNIFEEDPDSGEHKLVTVLTAKLLPVSAPGFARAFDARNQDVLLSFGRTGQDAGLGYFQRGARSGFFEFVSATKPPRDAAASGELFGESVVLGPRNMALVGSPTVDRARGGRIYVVIKNAEGIWDIQQAVSDPWNGPTVQFPNNGVFGRFIHANRDFTLVSVSANRLPSPGNSCTAFCAPDCDDSCSPDPQSPVCVFDAGEMVGPCTMAAVVIFSVDQLNKLLIVQVDQTQRLFQEQSFPTQFVDPNFGQHLTILSNSSLFPGSKILLGSPLNQVIATWTM
jgi:hypothetical protein